MHEIKDEPILGNQSLFNCAPEDAVCVIKTNDGNKYFFSENDSKAFGIYLCFAGQLEISMRRVIRTPVWTKADQLAGKLPEVGAKVDGGVVVFVNGFNVITELESGAVIVSSPKTFLNTFKPIESPEERAKREADEWVSKAWSETAAFIGWPGLCAECELKRGE